MSTEKALQQIVSKIGVEKALRKIREASTAPGKKGSFGHKVAHPFTVVSTVDGELDTSNYIIRYEDELYKFSFWENSWEELGDLSILKVEEKQVLVTVYEPTDWKVYAVKNRSAWY